MTKLRALVLEDEWAARNYLTELLEGTGLASVVAAAANTEQAWAAVRSQDLDFGIDVAFVDVRLAGEPSASAGVDWLRGVKSSASCAGMRFVLTTASREHAIEAFELGAVDYLVKPFTGERVAQCLHKLVARTGGAPPPGPVAPRRIVARDGKSLVVLPVERVFAFEAAEGLSYVYTEGRRYDIDLSLAALVSVLGEDFVRVHRNWLANLVSVRSLEREGGETRLVVGDAGLRVPVARDRVTHVREALMASSVGVRRVSG